MLHAVGKSFFLYRSVIMFQCLSAGQAHSGVQRSSYSNVWIAIIYN